MNKARDLKHVILGAAVAVSGVSALAAMNLTTFAPGTPIKSSEVNANFSSLKANIEALQAPIDVSRLSISGTAADGKVLKLQNGNLAWADDLTGGAGGAAYSAGAGLSLTGTTFSLADGGVTAGKLEASGGADGKVLKLSGGKLTWADDLVGSGGSTYTADGSSLQLIGTKFSIKDGGVGTAKIADASVTAGKINLPLNLSVSSGAPVILAANSSGIGLVGTSTGAAGVVGNSETNAGMLAASKSGIGVQGTSESAPGMFGQSRNSNGVQGFSGVAATGLGFESRAGVRGESRDGAGVVGLSGSFLGVGGFSMSGDGVHGRSESAAGVYGTSTNASALFGENNNSAETLKLWQQGIGGLIDAHAGSSGITVFSVDNKGNVFSRTNSYTSDRNAKTNFSSVDARNVLEKIAAMPVTRWNYKHDTKDVEHIGPMAQDFHAAFGLNGSDDTRINTVDMQGVALAAIQGLNQKLETVNIRLKSENASLRVTLSALEARLSALEKATGTR